MSDKNLPWWLGPASRANVLLLRLGLRIGSQHVLFVPGRTSGRMRSTPVSLVTLDGARYIVSGQGMEWVKNARAAGWVMLERAGRRERATLSELAPAERGPILRAFWHQVPQGRPFIARLFGLPSDASADDFEAAAPRCPVFRLDPPGLVVEGSPTAVRGTHPGPSGQGSPSTERGITVPN